MAIIILSGQVLVGTCAVCFLILSFFLLYGPFNKISFNETSITEKTLFGLKTINLSEIQQIGLVFRAYRKRYLIKESFAPLDANHTEIYILNYCTSDVPDFMDKGQRIILDYNHEMWRFFKNNPQLQNALKQGELGASRTKTSLFK
jgi:hypothetical protein